MAVEGDSQALRFAEGWSLSMSVCRCFGQAEVVDDWNQWLQAQVDAGQGERQPGPGGSRAAGFVETRKAGRAQGRCQAAVASWHRKRLVVPTHLQDRGRQGVLTAVVTKGPLGPLFWTAGRRLTWFWKRECDGKRDLAAPKSYST